MIKHSAGWLFMAVLLLATAATPVLGQTPSPNEVNAVARELWCPLCNGVRLDNCELKACQQMKELIAIKLAEGQSTEQIKAYFVEQYGDVVLGAPRGEGFSLVVWLFPVVGAVLGAALVAYLVLAWRRRRPAPAAAGTAAESAPAAGADDEYLQRVEDALKRMD